MSLSILGLGNLGTRRQDVFNHLADESTKTRSKRNLGVYFAHEEGEVTVTGGGLTPQGQLIQRAKDLIEALSHRFVFVRENAALALGETGKDTADIVIPALTKALGDRDVYVRENAALALARIGKEAPDIVISALTKALGDRDVYVRDSAALALRKIKSQ